MVEVLAKELSVDISRHAGADERQSDAPSVGTQWRQTKAVRQEFIRWRARYPRSVTGPLVLNPQRRILEAMLVLVPIASSKWYECSMLRIHAAGSRRGRT